VLRALSDCVARESQDELISQLQCSSDTTADPKPTKTSKKKNQKRAKRSAKKESAAANSDESSSRQEIEEADHGRTDHEAAPSPGLCAEHPTEGILDRHTVVHHAIHDAMRDAITEISGPASLHSAEAPVWTPANKTIITPHRRICMPTM
jgi:hypothetical protein